MKNVSIAEVVELFFIHVMKKDVPMGKIRLILAFLFSVTADWVLDGKLTKNENSMETDIVGVTVSRTGYVIRNLDGSTQSGKYKTPDLPALRILLSR